MQRLLRFALVILLSSVCISAQAKAIPFLYKTGKFGFVDDKGNKLGEAKYDAVVYNGSYSHVRVGVKNGIVDSTGKELIAVEYKTCNHLADGFFRVQDFNRKYALVNPQGKLVTEFIYDYMSAAGKGYFRVDQSKLIGLLNSEGKEIIPASYTGIRDFEYSSTVAYIETAVDKTITAEYYVIDNTGKKLYTTNHEIALIGADVLIHTENIGGDPKNKKVYLTNLKGNVTKELKCDGNISMEYTWATWNEGLLRFGCNGKTGFVDKGLNIVIAPRFDRANDFHNDRAAVKEGDKWSYINKKGEKIFEYTYWSEVFGLPDFTDKYIYAFDLNAGLCGALDMSGKIVVPVTYQNVMVADDEKGFFAIKQLDKWGILDIEGKKVIPFLYDDISCRKDLNGILKVKRDGQEFYMDFTGKEYREI